MSGAHGGAPGTGHVERELRVWPAFGSATASAVRAMPSIDQRKPADELIDMAGRGKHPIGKRDPSARA